MEWWEKEDRYERQYRSGRVARDLWKYIPKKVQEGVTDALADSDGYWVYLGADWVAYDGGEDCGTIHEYTISDLIDAVKTIRRGKR
jgi:hypothetical protein